MRVEARDILPCKGRGTAGEAGGGGVSDLGNALFDKNVVHSSTTLRVVPLPRRGRIFRRPPPR